MAIWIKTEPPLDPPVAGTIDSYGGTGQVAVPYLVYWDTSGGTPTEFDNATATGIPQPYADYDGSGSLFAASYQVEQANPSDNSIYRVTVTFRSTSIAPTIDKPPDAGDNWHMVVSGQLIARQETITSNVDYGANANKPIVNSAGMPVTPQLTRTFYDEKITAVWITDAPDWDGYAAVKGCANDASITLTVGPTSRTFEEHTLKWEEHSWSMVYGSDSTPYVVITAELIHRPETWSVNFDDVSYQHTGDDGTPVNNTDSSGNDLSQPQFLDGSGNVLTAGADVVQLVAENVEDADLSSILEW